MTGSAEAKSMAMAASLETMAEETTAKYAADNGIAIENLQ